MLYESARDWLSSKTKRILLFGMSGLGKTHVSNMLRDNGNWFHYSVDYRIGTRYMGEHIADNFKREAMKVPLLRNLLLSDSVYIQSNITFDNLAPLSTYLGKPGSVAKGGLPFREYMHRQALHRRAEIEAMLDTEHFIARARALYGYDNFVCDSSGSVCEVVNPEDSSDPVLGALSQHLLMIWIEGSGNHTEELIRRFVRAPKPMYYRPEILEPLWNEYLKENKILEDEVDPDEFVRLAYSRALKNRQPRYGKMAQNWGVSVKAEEIADVRDAKDFIALVARALERH